MRVFFSLRHVFLVNSNPSAKILEFFVSSWSGSECCVNRRLSTLPRCNSPSFLMPCASPLLVANDVSSRSPSWSVSERGITFVLVILLSLPLACPVSHFQGRFLPLPVNLVLVIVVFVIFILVIFIFTIDDEIFQRICWFIPTFFNGRRCLLRRLHTIKKHDFVLA